MAKTIMLLKKDILTILTIGALFQTLLGLFGLYGALKHKKVFIAIYLLLIWPVTGLFMADGYLAYKESHSFQFQMANTNLWSQLGAGTAIIQKKVECRFLNLV